jgi:hypothetical protein
MADFSAGQLAQPVWRQLPGVWPNRVAGMDSLPTFAIPGLAGPGVEYASRQINGSVLGRLP